MAALERVPGKIVAVHVSYRSRAAERGTLPAWPSYFLKPSSSLAESDDQVARPPGCELLAFEGEVALVIGRRARRVSRADGWDHVAWITAANDFGVYDLRYADRGSNVRSKGIDGFTPLGPRLIDARAVDLATVRLRTWVNGNLAQDAWPAQDMLFGFGDIVADLSRLVTLEPGDVILTGTPTGSTVVNPGDVVEVEVTARDESSGRLRSPVTEADYRLDPPGAMPRAPALASGCTVVLKPAEWTPLSASLLPEIMTEAGLPGGVFNLVNGIGEVAGAALVAHPGVPRISFTGETSTGRAIMAAAAPYLKGLSMELGGKSPCVIFADADLDEAIDSALFGVFSLNGERCTAGSRILAERAIYDALVTRLASRAERIRVGDPADPRTEIGALVHPEHYARVLGYVRAGQREGARLVAGGRRPRGLAEHLMSGNYLAATVFADVEPSMRIFREEIFGPVVCVTPFGDEAEAVALANATDYGLAAYIWTGDLARAHRVAHAVEAGMTWINSHNVRDLRTPFGGVKASGVGREGGPHSLDFYSQARIVHIPLGDTHVPRFGA
jgi:2-keto-4-pentenoate hydratase/2-oxohepta-3-ene-1,7-dioic acid hydratase in catechol pathway